MNLPVLNRRDCNAMDNLAASIPRIACKGLCQQFCGTIAATRLEVDRITTMSGAPLEYKPATGQCSKLTHEGRCSVYNRRPIICRLWGVSEELRCPHGCIPDAMLTKKETDDIIKQSRAIGGEIVFPTQIIDPSILAKCNGDAEAIQMLRQTNAALSKGQQFREIKRLNNENP